MPLHTTAEPGRVASTTAPLVSVVIPLFNSEAYIGQTVASVLAQTYQSFELIIVDDGSTDSGPAICRNLSDPRIRILTQANAGVSEARNRGVRAARGAYIAFLDADDLWALEKLARHVAHLQANPQVGFSFSHARLVDEDGTPIGAEQRPPVRNITPAAFLLRDPVGSGSNLVLRRAAIDAARSGDAAHNGLFDTDPRLQSSEDSECWLRLCLTSGYAFEGIPEVLLDYRLHAGGHSHVFERKLSSWQVLIEKVAAYAPALAAEYRNASLAYQLTALARRAVNQGNAAAARHLCVRALRTYPGVLVEEPAKTAVTLLAAAVISVVPKRAAMALRRAALHRYKGPAHAPTR